MLKRFSISLDNALLEIFDQYIDEKGYSNRSEAIRDLIRREFVQKEWQEDRDVMGVISLVYDHHHSHLQKRVTELQHDFHHAIVSTTHVHMDHDNCLEVIIVKGKAGGVVDLAQKLASLKGVRDSNLAMNSTGKSLH